MADPWETLGYDRVSLEIGRQLSETADIELIQGPPGVGKSWLAKGVGAMWESAGGGVVVVEGDSSRSDVSLHPFEIAMGALGESSKALLSAAAALTKAAEVLIGTGGLLTTSIETMARLQGKLRGERAILLDRDEQAILAKLAKLGRKRPLLLIADNLHWWDPRSLALLDRLRDERIGRVHPFLAQMRVLAVETLDRYQAVAHPEARKALLKPGITHSFRLGSVPRKGFEDLLVALGSPHRPSKKTADLIHGFSGGHLVLVNRCVQKLQEDDADDFLSAMDSDDFLQKLLSERLRSLGPSGEEAMGLLQVAAASGLRFRRDELSCATQRDEAETLRLLRYCGEEHILDLTDDTGVFVHDLYRQHFLDEIGEDRFAIYEALGDCLRKLRPADYQTRCIVATEAGQPEDAAVFALQAALQRQREGLPWRSLPGIVHDAMAERSLTWVAECFERAIEHTKHFRTAECIQTLSKLPHDLPWQLIAESDYVQATALMTTRSEKDRADAQSLLESWADSVEDEPEIGLRLMLLRLYQMAMQVDKTPGVKLEGRIRQLLRKRVRFDPAAEDMLYTLDRCAGAIHPPDRALSMHRRAAEHFGSTDSEAILRRPVEYYLCLLNLGSEEIANGQYRKAQETYRKLDHLVSSYETGGFPRLDYPNINALLADYHAGTATISDAVRRQKEIVATHKVPDDPFHVENSLACYLALAGAHSEAIEIFEHLIRQLTSRQDPEPSMLYLIRANHCAARFVIGDVHGARSEWAELGEIVIDIPYTTRQAMMRRHELLAAVIADGQPMSALEFDECLLTDPPPEFKSIWPQYGRAFRMPAIQWWR